MTVIWHTVSTSFVRAPGDSVCAALASALNLTQRTIQSLDLRDNNLTGPTETSLEAVARSREPHFFLPQHVAPPSRIEEQTAPNPEVHN